MIDTGPGWVVRRWVLFYTRGLAPEIRDRRRDEIDADLWSQLHEAALIGRPTRSTNAEILTRWLAGIPADLNWRMEHRGGEAMTRLATDRRGVPVGGLLIFGGLGLVALFVRYASISTDNNLIWVGTAGVLAIAAAIGGMVVAFRDRLDDQVVVAAQLGAVAAAASAALYFLIILLPLATVPVVTGLARAGVVRGWVAAVHVAAGALYVLGILVGLSGGDGAGLVYAVMTYPLSLALLGFDLIAGAVRPRAASAAAG